MTMQAADVAEGRKEPRPQRRMPRDWSVAGGNGGTTRERRPAERLARGLGWFSLGLGLAEVAAPQAVARAIGVGPSRLAAAEGYLPQALRPAHNGIESTLRLFGLREIAAGLGIFSKTTPANWVWARVAGDIMDLAYLGSLADRADRRRLAAAAVAVAGVTALDVLCGRQLGNSQRQGATIAESDGSLRVTASIAVNRPPAECYAFWRDLENLPRVMPHLESVSVRDGRHSHWRAAAPGGVVLEWDAEITEDHPNELIAWRSLEDATVFNEGSVRFQAMPKGRGTVVKVAMRYKPPAGAVGSAVAKLLGGQPERQIRDDLRRFKRFLEVGGDVTTEGQPHGPARLSLVRAVSRS